MCIRKRERPGEIESVKRSLKRCMLAGEVRPTESGKTFVSVQLVNE